MFTEAKLDRDVFDHLVDLLLMYQGPKSNRWSGVRIKYFSWIVLLEELSHGCHVI